MPLPHRACRADSANASGRRADLYHRDSYRSGRLTQDSFAKKIYSQDVDGVCRNAIQVTTVAGLCTMIELLRKERLPQRGFIRQEDARLSDLLGNRFGRLYL